MNETIQRIENLFKDDSMPPMILLDGSWGSGKTYFIKNKLIPYFEKKHEKVVFFSLYGVSDLNDFRDKLLSVYSLNDKDASSGFKDFGKILTNLGTALGESNASNIGAIANSLTGMVKHAALGRIKNFTLILDDLERVTDNKLIGSLLGECIELAENNNIKIIVAANANQITDNTTLEKAFIDKVSYKKNNEEMVSVALEGTGLIDQNRINIKNEVIRLGYTNLRVLKRALFRLKPILTQISESDEIIHEPSLKIATSAILSICFALYDEKDYSKEMIENNVVRSAMKGKLHNMKKKATNQPTKEEEELPRILSNVYTAPNVIDYCSGDNLNINIIDDLNLPQKSDPLNSMLTGNYVYFNDDDFAQGIVLLKKCITSKKAVNIEKWGRSCDALLSFSQLNYIDDAKESIWNTITEFKDKVNFAPNSGFTRWINNINDPELRYLLIEKSDFVKNKSQEIEINAFKDVMINSWIKALEIESHSSMSNQVLAFTDAVFLKECIGNWDALNIREFEIVLDERYKVLTTNSYEQEFTNLDGIIAMLEEQLSTKESSLKKGELTYLLNTSRTTLDRLASKNKKESLSKVS